ncbi:DUF4437 domain-containing protein [Halovivax limisalsi]|uniref:DUF4437 domain-containing protein n=1 Tax=Halovivax limisalsi TaxID=1453760 RepID=UPI001FFCF808|nr:DUF4437 domain-containing protein [Halovivax limisalsi]
MRVNPAWVDTTGEGSLPEPTYEEAIDREHIEYARNEEYPWQEESLSGELPAFRNKVLSIDERTGAFTREVVLPQGWATESVTFPTVQELFVIEGNLTVEGYELDETSYLRVPDEMPVSMAAQSETRLLWTSDSALDGDGDHDGHRYWHAPEDEITHVDPKEMEWEITPKEGPGDGLESIWLWHDEVSGATTFLCKAEVWMEERQVHHDVAESCYILEGGVELEGRGMMEEGDYFWRPAWIHHGPIKPHDNGFYGFLRVDANLVNYYTSPEGVPLNY